MKDRGCRQFWLENEQGERISLNGEHGWLLSQPSGLGYTSGVSYANLKNGFFTPTTEDRPRQASVAGELVFFGRDPYTQYRFFADWILKAQTLYLLYIPRTTLYRRRVALQYLTKTERERYGVLTVPVALYGLTPWYLPAVSDGIPSVDVVEDPFRLDDDGSLFDEDVFDTEPLYMRRVTVTPEGQLPAAFTITVEGPLTRPAVQVTRVSDGTTVGRCELAASFKSGETFAYSTVPDDCYIEKRFGADTEPASLLDDVTDLTEGIYPLLTPDEAVTITITSDDGITGAARIEIHDFLKGV